MNESDSVETSDLFIILGSANPQRFEIVWQMAEYLIYHGETVEVCHHADDTPPESPALQRLLAKSFTLSQWSLKEATCNFHQAPLPKPGVTTLFVGHGSRQLVDTIETISFWLPDSGFNLQRVSTWVDCTRVAESPAAKKWYECCFHFTDLVILDEFKNLPLSWLQEYKDFFKKECFPCILENTKKGRLHDMFLVMDNQIRRIAQVFEKPDDQYEVFPDDDDEDDMEDDEDVENTSPENEPYFERLVDGRRSKLVPDPL